MRRVTTIVAAVLMASVVLLGTSCGGAEPPATTASYAERVVRAGEVEVKLTPQTIDTSGATIRVVLDTHSVELDVDLRAAATLTVNGQRWATAGWDGDPPSGHHREGVLRFDAGGPIGGTADLKIDGLPAPVSTEWQIP